MTITPQTVDSITELVNIGAGKAANAMNQLLGSHVKLSIPWVDFKNTGYFDLRNMTGIQMRFNGEPRGYAQLLFKNSDIPDLIQGMLGFSLGEIDNSLKDSALSEMGNIVINAIVGSICNMTSSQVIYDVPEIVMGDTGISRFDDVEKTVMKAGTEFVFEKLDISAIMLLFVFDSSFLDRVQI
ncbi:MAG: hypothetical protein GX639_13495 [Fibrobacter sp.]|nr:hypothetical protein [Fibrobacter sp.]